MKTIQTRTFSAATAVASANLVTTPDGVLTNFSGTVTLTAKYIKPGTFITTATVGAASIVTTDNGAGVLAGTGVTGTINYATGAWTLIYGTAPDDTTDITFTYSYITVSPVQVTAASTGVAGVAGILIYEGRLLPDIIPDSVSLIINFSSSPVTFSDNASGIFSGTGLNYGYIDYNSGYFKLVFNIAPDAAAAMTATYKHRNGSTYEELINTNLEDSNMLVVKHDYSTTQYFHLSYSEDDKVPTYVGTYSVPPGSFKLVQLAPRKFYRIYGASCKLKVQLDVV